MPLRGGPCAAERRPCAAKRRSLCREEALCAGMSSVLRGLEEAPASGGGPCAERRPSMLVGTVLCAERIGGGLCVGMRPLCREEALYAGRSCPLC